MNYIWINSTDIANGIGVRVSLFVSGCDRHCTGCHNRQAWDFNRGSQFTQETMESIFGRLGEDFISGLTILGGEPLNPENIGVVREIAKNVRRQYPDKTIWIYTGYTYEEIADSILTMIDVLVDGPYIEAERDITLKFRGSRNQRIIDVPKSLASGGVVLYEV